ncbi:LamG domain-containing protein [Nonomuraea sp. NPDC001636]|uniref:LamG domain-containing protein n=1 Tax=Nonomuraea sp. NPDC001636 TaxID=3154391 RepID=UPI0033269081
MTKIPGRTYGLYASTEYSAPAGWLETTDEQGGLTGNNPLPLNQWSHLATTYDGSTFRLYINGAQVAQAPIAGVVLDDGEPLRFGGNSFWGEFFSGLIDEVRIYNRVQTATEIQSDMSTPVGTAATSIAAQRSGTGAASGPAAAIEKMAVTGSRTVEGVAVTSTATPPPDRLADGRARRRGEGGHGSRPHARQVRQVSQDRQGSREQASDLDRSDHCEIR